MEVPLKMILTAFNEEASLKELVRDPAKTVFSPALL